MTDELHEPRSRHAHAARAASTLDWRAWLAGGTPREVLARIVQGDPLEVRDRVARKLREAAYLFDADRVHLRALARCARAAPSYRGRPELDAWLDGLVDEALVDLLREDDELALRGAQDSAAPSEVGHEYAGAWVQLSRPLGLDARSLGRACHAFNRLAREERRAFFELVLEGRSLDELVQARSHAGHTREEAGATAIARRARRALCVLLEHTDKPSEASTPNDSDATRGDPT